MAKKQFKAESKRLLEMMINSIYTQKEIFLQRAHLQCQRCDRQNLLQGADG